MPTARGSESHASSTIWRSASERSQWLANLPPSDLVALEWSWRFWARPEQLSPWSPERGRDERNAALKRWRCWLYLAGRGAGKSRAGSEAVIEEAILGGADYRIAIVSRTAADVRDTMIEGESGLIARSPPKFRPHHEPSKRRLTWPNGARATAYSADEPEQLRGPQHHFAWADELGAWWGGDAWDQLQFGLRLGHRPRAIVTTTPRPRHILRRLATDPETWRTSGTTYDNAANLPASFLATMRARYEGTTLGRQELHAEILEEMPGALWTRSSFEAHRQPAPELSRIVVAIDPAVTATENSNETGIVVAGRTSDGHGYVLADRSGIYTPDGWARAAIDLYREYRADRIVAEANQGGDLVEHCLRTVDPNVAVTLVHAARGKQARAEPVAALYEQGRVHHPSPLVDLEDQACTWVPGQPSPDRVDALVWALTDLLLDDVTTGAVTIESVTLCRENPWRR